MTNQYSMLCLCYADYTASKYNKMLTCQIVYNPNNQRATGTPGHIFTILQLLLKHATTFRLKPGCSNACVTREKLP